MLSSKVKRGLVAGLVAISLPALAACAASYGAETQQPYTPSDGVWANSDGLELRNILAVSPKDGSATLIGTILNGGSRDDRLVNVTFRGGRAAFGTSPITLPAREPRVLGVDSSLGRAVPVALEGSPLKSGLVVPLTFEFERAGSVTLDVLVVPDQGPYATVPAPGATLRPTVSAPPVPATPSPKAEDHGGH
ncbi:hypothetical protein [Actinopolymorpha alba]|uniref:hypothetical protein n=1 Tax=Actinopolymorpha alba TaxID=533267 RepID=UPI00035C8681|nr:hypothetical protein [Actinopolymorpha alba]